MKYNQPYGISDPNGAYINGDPSTGTAGSIPPAASIEYPQREIANLIGDVNLAAPTNSDLHQLAKAIQSNLLWSDDDAGTANQYQVTQIPAPTAYFKYMIVVCKIGNANTGASTLNVNALGAKPIRHIDNTELSSGELKTNALVALVYDGTNFQIVWNSGGVAGGAPGTSGGPVYLSAPLDLYVNTTTGNDATLDGTSATVVGGTIHGPFKTLQRAANEATKYNLNGYNVGIHVANGTYTAGVRYTTPSGNGVVTWTGNSAAPSSVLVSPPANTTAIAIGGTGTTVVDGFRVTSSGGTATDAAFGMNFADGRVTVQNCDFGACGGCSIGVVRGAQVLMGGTINISGNVTGNSWSPASFIQAFAGGQCGSNPATFPLTMSAQGPSNVGSFIWASQSAGVNFTWTSFTTFANITGGKKYDISLNATVNTGGAGASYYPGASAGTTATGGQYA